VDPGLRDPPQGSVIARAMTLFKTTSPVKSPGMPWHRPKWILLAASLVLAGCQQELYSNISELEANQMLATLLANGIAVEKTSKGKEGFTITVNDRDMLRAVAVLNDSGFPKNSRESIGKVFQKSGIMSSPFEERVRYIYALGEEVSQTLSQIDGVVTAR